MYNFNAWFSIVLRIGALVFWILALASMPDTIPKYIDYFALFILWSFIAVHLDINSMR